jgi:ribosomal protein L23
MIKQTHTNKLSVKYLVEEGYEVLTTDVMTLVKKDGTYRIVDAQGRSWRATRYDVDKRTGKQE